MQRLIEENKMKIFMTFVAFWGFFTFVGVNESFALWGLSYKHSGFLNTFSKVEYYKAGKKIHTGHRAYTFQKVGNSSSVLSVPDIDTGKYDTYKVFTYLIFSLSNTESDDSKDIILQINYTDFVGNPADLIIKELPSDFSLSEVIRNSPPVPGIIEEIEKAEIRHSAKIDNEKGSYCPDDELTVRFEVTNLPTTPVFGEQAVFAIGVSTDKLTSFSVPLEFGVNAYNSGCIIPWDEPPPARSDNCIAYASGEVIPNVPINTALHLVAVPQNYSTKKIYIETWMKNHLPSGFYIEHLAWSKATLEYDDGMSSELPDTCKTVQVQQKLGSHWVKLRMQGRFEIYNIEGKLVDWAEVDKYAGEWNWTVVERPVESFAKRANIPPYFPPGGSPDTHPIVIRTGTSILVNYPTAQDLIINQDVFIENDTKFWIYNLAGGKLKFGNNARIYASGDLIIDDSVEIEGEEPKVFLQNITVGIGESLDREYPHPIIVIVAGKNPNNGNPTHFTIQGNGETGGIVTIRAGRVIHLKPGFTAQRGSKFHASIDPNLSK